MKITVVNARELTDAHWAAWQRLQAGNPDLASPYFSADFTRRVAAIRKNVHVAVFGSLEEPAAFFPYQRRGLGFADPVGSRLSDFHGVIAPRDFSWDVQEFMRACGLSSWEFHALVGSSAAFGPFTAGHR